MNVQGRWSRQKVLLCQKRAGEVSRHRVIGPKPRNIFKEIDEYNEAARIRRALQDVQEGDSENPEDGEPDKLVDIE